MLCFALETGLSVVVALWQPFLSLFIAYLPTIPVPPGISWYPSTTVQFPALLLLTPFFVTAGSMQFMRYLYDAHFWTHLQITVFFHEV